MAERALTPDEQVMVERATQYIQEQVEAHKALRERQAQWEHIFCKQGGETFLISKPPRYTGRDEDAVYGEAKTVVPGRRSAGC